MSGMTSRLPNRITNIRRSHVSKRPVTVMPTSRIPASGTATHERNTEVRGAELDTDELRGDRQEVEHEQVADGEASPDVAETLEDETPVPDSGHRAESHDHLLVDDEHRDEQQQRPEQRGAVVLSCRRVCRDAARVVVADHHDEAGSHDHGKGKHPPAPRARSVGVVIVLADRAEGAADVAMVCVIAGRLRGLSPSWRPACEPSPAPSSDLPPPVTARLSGPARSGGHDCVITVARACPDVAGTGDCRRRP